MWLLVLVLVALFREMVAAGSAAHRVRYPAPPPPARNSLGGQEDEVPPSEIDDRDGQCYAPVDSIGEIGIPRRGLCLMVVIHDAGSASLEWD